MDDLLPISLLWLPLLLISGVDEFERRDDVEDGVIEEELLWVEFEERPELLLVCCEDVDVGDDDDVSDVEVECFELFDDELDVVEGRDG